MTNLPAEFSDRKNYQRKHNADRECHLPIDVKHHGEKNKEGEALLKEIGEIFRERDAGLLDVVDHRGEHTPSGVVLKKSDRLADDSCVHLVAQVGNGRVPGILNFGYAEVFGDALGNKN